MINYFSVLTMSARCSAYALVMEKMTLLAGILLLFTACGECALRYAWIVEEREGNLCMHTFVGYVLMAIKMFRYKEMHHFYCRIGGDVHAFLSM